MTGQYLGTYARLDGTSATAYNLYRYPNGRVFLVPVGGSLDDTIWEMENLREANRMLDNSGLKLLR